MLRRIRDLITRELGAGVPEDREHAVRLATAALLVEMARADMEASTTERERTLADLAGHFGLDAREADELLVAADARADQAVSLHEFTSGLNAALGADEKARVVELLWRVAYADGRLDKYEDHLVRKVAELLYVPHTEFIRLKHVVRDALGIVPDP